MPHMALLFILAAGLCLTGYALRKSRALSSKTTNQTSRPIYIIPQDLKPYQLPTLKIITSTSMKMGFKRLDEPNWLTNDSNYLPEHNLRIKLLSACRPNVIACLPPSIPACYEVLELVVSFLTARFPEQYTTSTTATGPIIKNHVTGETFPVGPHPHCQSPLEIAALLAMEDFNILMKDPITGDYNLQASATLFPAGWKLQERIGGSLALLHGPVPGWHEKIGAHVNRYFGRVCPKSSMERTNLFIQTTDVLFQDEPEVVSPTADLKAENMTVRRERQTFRRLVKSGAVLFTVRTYMTPLVDLDDEELRGLRSQIWAWEDDIREYKGWATWGPKVEEWCEGRIGKREEIEIVKTGGCPM